MQRALQHEWTFIQRAVPCESAAFKPLESAIQSHFLPSLIGSKVDADLRAWTSVPIKQGGMEIPMPNEMQDLNHRVSTCECSHLVRCMKGKESFDPVYHSAVVREVREEGKSQRQMKADEALRKVKRGMDKKGARRLDYLQERGTGTWLAATPTFACGTILSPVEFRDELRDRYGLDLLNVPAKCDGCNANFSVSHAMGCKVGGLISSRHNEGRDALVCFASA